MGGLGSEIQYLQVLPGGLSGLPVLVWVVDARHWSHSQWGARAFLQSQRLQGLLECREQMIFNHRNTMKYNFTWELWVLQTDMLNSLSDQGAKHAKLPWLIAKYLEANTFIHTNFILGKTVSFKLQNSFRTRTVSCLHKHFGRQSWAF